MGKIFLNSIQYCGGNGNSAAILHKYTATLTSSQYGWFTFVDENGNVIAKDSTKTPVLATALDGAKYYFGSFFVYEAQNRYLFKVYDINDSSAHGYVGTSKTLTFDLTYVESSSAFGGHSYNTTEQVVGTWIDGSTVYEKTYVVPTSLSSGALQVIDESFPGTGIIEWSGYNVAANGDKYILPDGHFRLFLPQSNNALTIASINGGVWNGTSYITIKYIK